MTTERFNVVLQGSTLGGQDAATVATELARLIKRDTEFALRLLRGQPTKLKSGVNAATGARYLEALERIDVAVRLEPETLEVDADLSAPPATANQNPPRHAASTANPRVGERVQAGGKFHGDKQQRRAMGVKPRSVSSKRDSDLDAAALAWRRLWARQIDLAISFVIALGLVVLLGAAAAFVGATHLLATSNIFVQVGLELGVGVILMFLALIGYETVLLATFGTTLGKAVLGLRVETQSGTKIEFERALRRSLGVLWRGSWAYVGFPVVTFTAWRRSRRCLRETGSTPWDDSCATRVAGGPVSLWRATLAGVIAITCFTIVLVFDAMGRKDLSREVQESIRPSPTPAAAAALSNQSLFDPSTARPDTGRFDPSTAVPYTPRGENPYALGYRAGFIDPDDIDAGDPSTLLNFGVRYAYGLSGMPQDNIEAFKWLNLAASRFPASQAVDRDNAVRVRNDVASKMTPAQIAKAQRLAREWTPK